MTPYQMMLIANELMIKGVPVSANEQARIAGTLWQGLSSEQTVNTFRQSLKTAFHTGSANIMMSPRYFVPPVLNKKMRTLTWVTPRTHLFSANAYELEIMRLLAFMDADSVRLQSMINTTADRLDGACFGRFCAEGECYETSLVALRFTASVFPDDLQRIQPLLDGAVRYLADHPRHSGTVFYFRLLLSELPPVTALPVIAAMREPLLQQLCRSYVANSSDDVYVNTLAKYILRNCLVRLPEYAYLQNTAPYLSTKDGRIHFDI
ncbi:hypothetical protein [Paenibacillus tepidiphilus]|uniref:hypothetical protein n=1 Tax=Paenibacillus tepidiphilus TaxID=2608683 RepID=UPI00123BF7F4|nr:hypothetical protein [Paenibacillus tepidiphilus]